MTLHTQAPKVPCNCETCQGRLVTPKERTRHTARALRQESQHARTAVKSHLVTFATANQSRPTTHPKVPLFSEAPPPGPASQHASLPVPSSSQLSSIAAAEIRGMEYMARVLAAEPELGALTDPEISDAEEDERSSSSSDDLQEDEERIPDDADVESGPTIGHQQPGVSDSYEDIFRYSPSTTDQNAVPSPSDIHSNRIVYLVYLLVFWLHAQCHLPFRACAAVLTCVSIILSAAGVILDPPMYKTLPSVMSALNVDPTFRIAPVCPKCQAVYSPKSLPTAACDKCKVPLYRSSPTRGQERTGRTTHEDPKPVLQFPYKSLEEQLATMLANPGIEDEMERALDKINSSTPGVWTNVFDGQVCQELPGQDGSKFFKPDDKAKAAGELRIGVSLGVDWYVLLYACQSRATLMSKYI